MDFDDVTPMIQNIIIMDSEGKRIAVKYYGDEWCRCSMAAVLCPLVHFPSPKISTAAGTR